MKKFILFLFITIYSSKPTFAQISIQTKHNNSITISPSGIKSSDTGIDDTTSIAIGYKTLLNNVYNSQSIAIGNRALSSNTIAPYNLAIGNNALQANTTGERNTAIGNYSMHRNINGSYNVSIGFFSLLSNTSGEGNMSIGEGSLQNNTEGSRNIAIGLFSLTNNKTGISNTAIGESSISTNTTGNSNTALGSNTCGGNGTANTAIGERSLWLNGENTGNTGIGAASGATRHGSYNTYIGYHSYNTSDSPITNSTAIGANTRVNVSNKIRLGDTNISVIEGQVPWSNPSDRRLKENIHYSNDLGLNFITRLQTTSYNYIADKSKIRRDGFIAQDVENALSELGIPFSGLQKSEDGTYSLSYSDFVMPLVNAVKEQQEQINELKRQNENLAQTLADLKDIRAEIVKLKEQSTLRDTDKK